MKVLKADSDFLIYQRIFKDLTTKRVPITLWQVRPESGERMVAQALVGTLDIETGNFPVQFVSEAEIFEAQPIYGYVQEGQFIFKSELSEVRERSCSIRVPGEIKLLEDQEAEALRKQNNHFQSIWRGRSRLAENYGPDIVMIKKLGQRTSRDQKFLQEEFGLSVDEEDALFADQRESPRARPKTEKKVLVLRKGAHAAVLHRLFDLSRGGIAFVSSSEIAYVKGTEVHILGFDEFELDDPLVGTVMSTRPLDETMSEFKVGLKFNEGQD